MHAMPGTPVVGSDLMRFRRSWLGVAVALALAACGNGEDRPTAFRVAELPLQRPIDASQAPIVNLGRMLHVGANVAAPAGQLPVVAHHAETSVLHGAFQDGVGAAELIAYLQADAASLESSDDTDSGYFPGGLLLRFQAMPPTIRVTQGTSGQWVDETVRVVQAINAALPDDWQLDFSGEPATADASLPSAGEILVTFAPQEDWSPGNMPPVVEDIGLAVPQFSITSSGEPTGPFSVEISAGRVWVDHTRTEGHERLAVLAHEILHLLGRNHVDPVRFPRTIMVAGGSEELPDHVLHPLDREALLAVYGHIEPGTLPGGIARELGSWSETSLHLQGALDHPEGRIEFGVALRNDLARPWASGPAPLSNLADSAELSETVDWSGRLLGLTSEAESVAGAAELRVELASLSGTMHFSQLEHWAANEIPGAAGTGTTWRDGNLRYQIEVLGNTFRQTGGDAGTVTGAFFGRAHEGMGGVVKHGELSAGFGGSR